MKIQGIYGGTYVIKSEKDLNDAVEAEQDAHFDACFGVPHQPTEAEIEQDRLQKAQGDAALGDCPRCKEIGGLCRACEESLGAQADYYDEAAKQRR